MMRDVPIGQRFPVENLEFQRWFYVYRYFDEAENLLYVGVTGDPYQRWTQHRRNQPWADEIDTVSLEQFAFADLAYAREREVIRAESPAYNVKSTEWHEAETVAKLTAARAEARARAEMEADDARLP